jgi:hypothetical protein
MKPWYKFLIGLSSVTALMSCSSASKIEDALKTPPPFCILEVDIAPILNGEYVPYTRYGIDTSHVSFEPAFYLNTFVHAVDGSKLKELGRLVSHENIRDDASHYFYEYPEVNGQITQVRRTTWPEWDSFGPSSIDSMDIHWVNDLASGATILFEFEQISENTYELTKTYGDEPEKYTFTYNDSKQLISYRKDTGLPGEEYYTETIYTWNSQSVVSQSDYINTKTGVGSETNYIYTFDNEGRVISEGIIDSTGAEFIQRIYEYNYNCEHPMFWEEPEELPEIDD